MNVFIVFRDVPYEFGDVVSVHSTQELADAALEEATKTKHHPGFFGGTELGIDKSELDVREWVVDGEEA